jgi:carbonic anhydrase/acetyltransferase-like protein (isoleucine patch superfamily)
MSIKKIGPHEPDISQGVYIAESAEVIGKVILNSNVSIWPNAVLRGDVEHILIEKNSNVQDGVLIHTNFDMPTVLGENVTVGHGAILHGCRIADNCLIGMGAILLDGSEIGEYTIIAAGSVVSEGKKLDGNSVYMGTPARRVRDITPEEKELIKKRALEYIEFSKLYYNN